MRILDISLPQHFVSGTEASFPAVGELCVLQGQLETPPAVPGSTPRPALIPPWHPLPSLDGHLLSQTPHITPKEHFQVDC